MELNAIKLSKLPEVSRQVSSFKQFLLLNRRMFLISFRIPVAFIALVMMGLFVGLNQGLIYKEVGSVQFDPEDKQLNVSISLN